MSEQYCTMCRKRVRWLKGLLGGAHEGFCSAACLESWEGSLEGQARAFENSIDQQLQWMSRFLVLPAQQLDDLLQFMSSEGRKLFRECLGQYLLSEHRIFGSRAIVRLAQHHNMPPAKMLNTLQSLIGENRAGLLGGCMDILLAGGDERDQPDSDDLYSISVLAAHPPADYGELLWQILEQRPNWLYLPAFTSVAFSADLQTLVRAAWARLTGDNPAAQQQALQLFKALEAEGHWQPPAPFKIELALIEGNYESIRSLGQDAVDQLRERAGRPSASKQMFDLFVELSDDADREPVVESLKNGFTAYRYREKVTALNRLEQIG